MKTIIKIVAVFFMVISAMCYSQNINEWNKLKPEEREARINKMTPEERMKLLKKLRESMLMEELNLPEEKQDDFQQLYSEYQESQKQIKSNFKSDTNYDNMSEEDAKKELEKSFIVGQQLMDNRKKYSEKFQKVIKPQQVLRMFENEGRMRDKVIDRKRDIESTRESRPERENYPNRIEQSERNRAPRSMDMPQNRQRSPIQNGPRNAPQTNMNRRP